MKKIPTIWLRGELYAMHNNGAWKTLQCACPDCAAWRATTKETTT